MVILAMGKFGGRELNYQSDLDLIFLYDADGQTVRQSPEKGDRTTSNQHFFGEVGQGIIKRCTQLGQYGRLFEIDARLRPSGKSGMLAMSLAGFAKYFADGQAQFWERQALCKARPVYGSAKAAARAMDAVHAAAYAQPWDVANGTAVLDMRHRLEAAASTDDLKRGPGGLVDVEFIAQFLQLKHGGSHPTVRQPGTLAALAALRDGGVLDVSHANELIHNYRFLRRVESRLRLMSTSSRNELPDEPEELRKLARLLGYSATDRLREDLLAACRANRAKMERLIRN
jgi:glutamate-ammonia-ligase adenylyltransferase